MEVVSQAEHLRRLVADARRSGDGPARQKVANDIKTATRGLQRAAESFGEIAIARSVQVLVEAAAALEVPALDALDALAVALSTGRAATPTPVAPIAAAPPPADAPTLVIPTPVRPSAAVPAQPPAPPAPPPRVSVPRPTPSLAPTPYIPMPAVSRATGAIVMPAPTGASLQHALESGLSSLKKLNEEPMAEPAHVDDDDGVVPIQDLVYRGKAALARAIEVGESIKSGSTQPDQETLAELFDLLELATSE
jgi:hypothetical protein